MDLHDFKVSTERRRLDGRTEKRGSKSGFSNSGVYIFGGVFVLAGGLITLIGTQVIPVDPKTVHAPWWVLTVFGTSFALAGLAVWSMGWKQSQAESARRENAKKYPGEAALLDYAWDTTSFETKRWARAISALLGAVGFSLFLSMFNYWAFWKDGPIPVKIVVVIFDLILMLIWWEAFIRLVKGLKFGGSRISFARFPYRLDEETLIRWHPAPGIKEALAGKFTLRCVEEWFEKRGTGSDQSSFLVHEELWSGTWHLGKSTTFRAGDVKEIRFLIPSGPPPSQLNSDKPVFWEFEVQLSLPGLDFDEVYLVPIYASRFATPRQPEHPQLN